MQNVKWDNVLILGLRKVVAAPPALSWGAQLYSYRGETAQAAMKDGGIDYNCGALYETNLASVVREKRNMAVPV